MGAAASVDGALAPRSHSCRPSWLRRSQVRLERRLVMVRVTPTTLMVPSYRVSPLAVGLLRSGRAPRRGTSCGWRRSLRRGRQAVVLAGQRGLAPRRKPLDLRWLLAFQVPREIFEPRQRLAGLGPVGLPLALDDVVHRAQRESLHLDRAEVPQARQGCLSESPYASFDNDPGEVARQLRQPLEGPAGFMAVESGETVRIQHFDDPRPRRFFRFAGAGPPDQVRSVVAPADPDTSDTKLVTVANPQLEQASAGGCHAAGESVAWPSGQDHASAREPRQHPLAKSRNGVRPQGAGLDVAHVAGRQRHMQEAGGGSGRGEQPGSRRVARHGFLHDASVVGAEHDQDYRPSVSSQ